MHAATDAGPDRAAASLPSLPMVTPSLWRHGDFRKLWVGQTVSELGSVVTRTAVPLVALLVLGAGPLEMALLVVSAGLAVLLVGFFAGAWVDRLRRRPLLIWADAMRAVLLFSIFVDAISFVVSAISLVLIRGQEPPRRPRSSATPMQLEILEGVRLVRRHAVLVPLTLRSIIAHVAGSFYGVLYTIYLIEDLHLSPFLLGVVVSAGGVGSPGGSL